MKLKTLEYFVALAESQSINDAAKKLYVAQPSLTKSLQLFEKELGVQLFYRSSSGIVLTEAGKKILPEAKQMLAYYAGWRNLSAHASVEQIDIFLHSSFPDFILPPILLRLRKKYPALRVNYAECLHPEEHISHSVRHPSLVFSICLNDEKLQALAQKQENPPLVLCHGEYRCMVGARSPLLARETVSMQDLNAYYLVVPDDGVADTDWSQPHVLRDILGSASRQRIIGVESVPNVISLLQQDPETYTLAYYPALLRYDEVARGALAHRPFQGRTPSGTLCLFYSAQAYRAHQVVREIVRAVSAAAKQFQQDTAFGAP